MLSQQIPEYGWKHCDATCAHAYLLTGIEKVMNDWLVRTNQQRDKLRLFDAGCGNGYIAHALAEKGFEVAGCDFSQEGVSQAKKILPEARFEVLSVYDDMYEVFGGEWDVVLSSEVIEHLYVPGKMLRNIYKMLKPAGLLVVTTPYHGYLKNLAISLSGKMDQHFTALWDGGHIKFWSYKTLTALLNNNGFAVEKFYGAGRLPYLWKSMIISSRKNIS